MAPLAAKIIPHCLAKSTHQIFKTFTKFVCLSYLENILDVLGDKTGKQFCLLLCLFLRYSK